MAVLKRENIFVGPVDPESDILVGPGGKDECGNLPDMPIKCPECGSTTGFNRIFCSECDYITPAARKSLEEASDLLTKSKV